MKVCIDGVIREVAATQEPPIEPCRNINDEVAELKDGFKKLQALFEPLVKLLEQK